MKRSELITLFAKLSKAEEILNSVYWDICEEKGYNKMADKLNGIIVKVDDIKEEVNKKCPKK